ncbi:short-chain dehydrogenase/reductase SDR [Collybia nuda]|uniref:Short-chain dehydrogenase/reductase SDR n=1 Tax=Collybia nuda TaxID=64659 RepID=A0A9P6CM28_9AGAR|nr:short-chain dehydrogenase/reductase SDR [Collybia nuda]
MTSLLEGKTAVVTGAASGIGFATVKLFLQSGVRGIVLVDLTISGLEKAVSVLSPDERGRCELLAANVTSEDTAKLYAEKAFERWGRLDISVQNAGIASERVGILDTEVHLWEKTMSVNALGVFLGIKHSGKAMLKNPGGASGSIVVVSSQLGLEGAPGLSAYSASKWAVRGLTLTAAEELTPMGLRVNSVCPGPIVTPLLDVFDKSTWPKMAGQTLMNRLGRPEEIANAILFLASDNSSYCSGTTLKVDGGYAKFG